MKLTKRDITKISLFLGAVATSVTTWEDEYIREYQHKLAMCFRLRYARYPREDELHELTSLADVAAKITHNVPKADMIVTWWSEL